MAGRGEVASSVSDDDELSPAPVRRSGGTGPSSTAQAPGRAPRASSVDEEFRLPVRELPWESGRSGGTRPGNTTRVPGGAPQGPTGQARLPQDPVPQASPPQARVQRTAPDVYVPKVFFDFDRLDYPYDPNNDTDLCIITKTVEDFMAVARNPAINHIITNSGKTGQHLDDFIDLVDEDLIWALCKDVVPEFRYHQGLPTDDAPRADPVNYILRSPGVKARRPPIPSRVPDAEDLLVRDAFRARVAYLETFGAGLRDAEPSLQGGAAELVSRFDAVRDQLSGQGTAPFGVRGRAAPDYAAGTIGRGRAGFFPTPSEGRQTNQPGGQQPSRQVPAGQSSAVRPQQQPVLAGGMRKPEASASGLRPQVGAPENPQSSTRTAHTTTRRPASPEKKSGLFKKMPDWAKRF